MQKIRCIAVDDEPLALGLIKSYIDKTPFLELAGAYSNGFEVVEHLGREKVELLFADIQMPSFSGLEIAQAIDNIQTKVIFTTAFDSYALDGFRVDAIDYLLKPISYPDFLRSALKAQRLIAPKSIATESTVNESMTIRSQHRIMRIDYNDVLYIEAQKDYVAITLTDGNIVKTISTIKGIESTLPNPPFCRVHRSFIVNLSKVRVMERNNIVFGKKLIPISEIYREDVLSNIKLF